MTELHGAHALTERQLEVLTFASHGYTNEGIGAALGVSPETVKVHLKQIYWHLNANDRAHAVAIALRQGAIH